MSTAVATRGRRKRKTLKIDTAHIREISPETISRQRFYHSSDGLLLLEGKTFKISSVKSIVQTKHTQKKRFLCQQERKKIDFNYQ
jgi:hypothetical protein